MSDKFVVIPIECLLQRIFEEEKTGQIFGIPKGLFFKPSPGDAFKMKRYGQILETPIGVAAGPHTQMAQNIITAWLTGARYLELKTVQTLDQIKVTKPCIDMEDEGYNCEWSQELTIKESFAEYLKAWIIIRILRHKFGWDETNPLQPGFIFNMSVGYNLEGILKENVQWFLGKMENCKPEKAEQIERLEKLYPPVKDLEIPDRLSDNITLSTMHGCPPEEIEKIAAYLLRDRKYHTLVKLNPTLLGPGTVRDILNKKLGYETEVPDEAFGHDLKYPEAVKIIERLTKCAGEAGVEFGLKLTNTLESVNHRAIFPATEKMMYMSGRALHPLGINLAAKLQKSFHGDLDISFCAGVDCFNIAEVIGAGLKPATACSDLLKPGGYARLPQYLENLSTAMKSYQAATIDEYILAKAGQGEADVKKAGLYNLENYAQRVTGEKVYRKNFYPEKSIKTGRSLGYFDCIEAPCVTTCPTNQDVPGYMYYTARGEYQKALEVILRENPFPSVTGKVCDHPCMTKCTRLNYDSPLQIRAVKSFISDSQEEEPVLEPAPKNGVKVAVIGAGPSGLSCAFYLALAGVEVDVYETREIPGGMVSQVIPGFRLTDEDIKKDLQRIEKLGVKIHYQTCIDDKLFGKLEKENDYIYIAAGAQKSTPMKIKGEDMPGVMDALGFLTCARRGAPRRGEPIEVCSASIPDSKPNLPLSPASDSHHSSFITHHSTSRPLVAEGTKSTVLGDGVDVGPKVAVVGGGNSAMDAGRAALRQVKEKAGGEVTILYRRSQREMPAAAGEIQAALEEGIKIRELVSPVEIGSEEGRLKVRCWKMKLGEKDETGRRRPIKIENSEFDLYFDTVITAIGQTVELDFLKGREWQPVKETGETAIKNVYIGGDALRGPSSIITAAADGKKVAQSMLVSCQPSNDGKLTNRPEGYKKFFGGPGPAARGAIEELSIPDPSDSSHHSSFIIHHSTSRPLAVEVRREYGAEPLEMTELGVQKEARRCLLCSEICNVCVTVCPNRANVSYVIDLRNEKLNKSFLGVQAPRRGEPIEMVRGVEKGSTTENLLSLKGSPCHGLFQKSPLVAEGINSTVLGGDDEPFQVKQSYQVYNIANFCNECGNCRTFCPTGGAPYKDKPKICLTEECFREETRAFFIGEENGRPFIKSKQEDGAIETLVLDGDHYVYETPNILAVLDKSSFQVKMVEFKAGTMPMEEVRLRSAVEMSILLSHSL